MTAIDFNKLVSDLTAAQASVLNLTEAKTAKEAEIAALNASVAELTTKVAELQAKADASDGFKTQAETAEAALVDTVKHVLALKGDVTTKVEGDVPAVLTLLKTSTEGLKLSAGAPSPSLSSDAHLSNAAAKPANSAFKRISL